MSDIVERLRDSDTTRRIGESYADVHHRRQADRDEAADEITRLTAENEKLDEAMEMLLTDVRRTDLDMSGLKAENERLSAYAKRAAMDVLLCKDGNILLHEKNEKLRAALEPFADMGRAMMGRKHPNEAVVQYDLAPTIKVFHLVRAHEARAAITPTPMENTNAE